jgi:hypothetical protein
MPVVIAPIGNPENSSFVTELNAAIQTLAGEFESVVYRAGTHNLTGNLDANSRRIFNLPAPIGPTEPVRFGDVVDFQGTPGEDGEDAPLPVWTFDILTGAAGTDAELDVTGTYPNQLFTFTIPRGLAGASGALTDGTYSGIIVGGTGTTLDVVPNHITFARMADLAGAGVVGAVAAGDPGLLTFATVKANLALTSADVGLGNVNNTSDANKPVSTATQTALDLKQNIAPSVSDNNAPATPFTPDGTKDLVVIRGLATNLTINAPSGSPSQGFGMVLRIKDNGTSRTLTWNAVFRVMSGVTLPTATTINKTHYVGCLWNSTDTKWDVMYVNVEA